MTLGEIIEDEFDVWGKDIKARYKNIAIKYARSIIPEEVPPVHYEASQLQEGVVIGKNDLRTQLLSRIEEDSK